MTKITNKATNAQTPKNNYEEEAWLLFKMLEHESFHFVMVHYNHYGMIERLQSDLKEKFPKRKFKKLDAAKSDYRNIMDAFYELEKGILWLENFEDILKIEPKQIEQTERKKGITAGLNLRRDKLAKSPIALILLIASTSDELYARKIMERMPDLWSFRSLLLDLKQETIVQESTRGIETDVQKEIQPVSTLGGETRAAKLKELNRLLDLLKSTPQTETAFLLSLYPQIVKLQTDLGQPLKALVILEEWEKLASKQTLDDKESLNLKAEIQFTKGKLYDTVGKLDAAQQAFKNSLNFYKDTDNKFNQSACLQYLGDIQKQKGNLNKAKELFEEDLKISKLLGEQNPDNVEFKNNLAIAYERIGNIHKQKGNGEKAFEAFQEYFNLQRELVESNPDNVEFKNGLAIAYSNIGDIHQQKGNWEKAFEAFQKYFTLRKELVESNPNNVQFKNGLSIAYDRIGDIHQQKGNWEKAFEAFQKYFTLRKELVEQNPNNVQFKNGLAVAYFKLSEINQKSGNIDQAILYCQKAQKILSELVEKSPNIVEYKSNLEEANEKLEELKDLLPK